MKRIFSLLVFFILVLDVSGQGKFTDSRDGNVYKTITIDKNIWMVENLRFKAPKGAYYFDNDPNNKLAYGVLYNWESALTVCPDGWHLPNGQEFQELVNYVDQKDGWKKGPADTTSFGIQLGGMQDYEGTFTEMDQSAYFWTSTEYDKENAEYFSYIIVVNTPVTDISRKSDISDIHGTEKNNKYSVRCVKN
jgi:uncharacterized protein (TIGR02145 family)